MRSWSQFRIQRVGLSRRLSPMGIQSSGFVHCLCQNIFLFVDFWCLNSMCFETYGLVVVLRRSFSACAGQEKKYDAKKIAGMRRVLCFLSFLYHIIGYNYSVMEATCQNAAIMSLSASWCLFCNRDISWHRCRRCAIASLPILPFVCSLAAPCPACEEVSCRVISDSFCFDCSGGHSILSLWIHRGVCAWESVVWTHRHRGS